MHVHDLVARDPSYVDPTTTLAPLADASPYISVDALVAYCRARMQEVDSGIHEHFAAQEQNNQVGAALGDAMQQLEAVASDGFKADAGNGVEILRALQAAIDKAGGPGTEIGRKLKEVQLTLAGKMSDGDYLKNALCDESGGPFKALMGGGPMTTKDALAAVGEPNPDAAAKDVGKDDVADLTKQAESIQNDLQSSSELNMIELQSLMSQRQTAVQLTTNLIQAMGDTTAKIAANIGH